MPRSISAFILVFAALPLAAQNSLTISDVPLLQVDAHENASCTFVLRNSGAQPVPLRLIVSDFVHTSSAGSYGLGAVSTIEAATGADKVQLDHGEVATTIHLKLTVSHLWEAGQSSAVLKNGDADIPTASGAPRAVLNALRIPAAYNVRIDPLGDAGQEIVFSKFGSTLVRLTNGDSMSYRFRWQLRSGNELKEAKNPFVDLPGGGSAYVDVTGAAPAISLFSHGTIKDEVTPGELVLRPVLDAAVGLPPIAPKVLPVGLRLQYWGGGLQQAITIFCVFILLTLGGMTSIWVHCGMPNTERALAQERTLREFQAKLDGVGQDVPSRTRALLEGHIDAVRGSLHSTWWIFPSFADTLDQVEKRMSMLSEWIDVTYNVATVANEARQRKQTRMPRTILQWIRGKSKCALTHFESGFTTPDEIQHMKDDVSAAQNFLLLAANGGAIPELEKAIQEREAAIIPRLEAIEAAFPGRFTVVIAQVRNHAGQPLAPSNYLERDTLSLKLDLIGQASDLINRATITSAMGAAASGGQPLSAVTATGTALARLRQHQERLVTFVEPDAPETLRMAQLFVNEMRQDIYEEALLAEVNSDPPEIAIVTATHECACGAMLLLSLKFKRQLLNEAAACREWTCTWDFGDGTMQEAGWEVYHSFRRPGQFKVSVSITNLNGDAVMREPFVTQITAGFPGSTLPWYRRLWLRLKPHAETMLEASRLAMVLALAVFGLVGSAQHQAESLTLIQAAGAVFALGFGADTLKNLITQRGATK